MPMPTPPNAPDFKKDEFYEETKQKMLALPSELTDWDTDLRNVYGELRRNPIDLLFHRLTKYLLYSSCAYLTLCDWSLWIQMSSITM